MTSDTIKLYPAPVRRVLASSILAVVGGMFWWAAANGGDDSWLVRVALAVVGVFWVWGGVALWRTTAHGLFLGDDKITDSSGAVLALISDIETLDRGAFSMKPSNGVLLLLSHKGPTVWMPGLWWRVGRRVGIGGLTPKADTKVFVDALQARLTLKSKTNDT